MYLLNSCLRMYILIHIFRILPFNWSGVPYVVAYGRGTVREFSRLEGLMDIKGKMTARWVFRSHTP